MQVFLSYARENIDDARKLKASLEQNDIDIWFDEDNLLPGQNWKLEISRAIVNSSLVILLVSNESLSKRGYVQVEMKKALNILEEIPDSDIFIIPVRINSCEIFEPGLNDLHWVDLFPSYQRGVESIMKAIELKSSIINPPEDELQEG